MNENLKNRYEYYDGTWTAQVITVVICSSIALYNALELLIWIAVTFRKAQGLYFWSLLAATLALLPYNIGFLLQFFQLTYQWLGMAFSFVGWVPMVTGQSLVLYSRLGLILRSRRILRAIKYMIIIDAVIWHTTTEILNYCTTFGPHQRSCGVGYRYIEKVQMTVFRFEELVISVIYVWQAVRILGIVEKKRARKVMWELLAINCFLICLDVGILAVEYLDYHSLEQTIKGFIYSVKLRMEFLILGRLVDLVLSANRNLATTCAENIVPRLRRWSQAELEAERGRDSTAIPTWVKDLDKSDTEQVEEAVLWRPSEGNSSSKHGTITVDWAGMIPEMPREDTFEMLQRRRMAQSDYYAEALRSISTRSQSPNGRLNEPAPECGWDSQDG
jgi:hypothetical protein